MHSIQKDAGLVDELIGDGRPLLAVSAVLLLLAGGFAIFLSLRREFLPHDVAFLGTTADALCLDADCRIVRFMFHDRVAFGGTLIAVATLYLWLVAFPLRQRQAWAWWTFLASGVIGFGSFLAYLQFGYLDTWHAVANYLLLAVFVAGMIKARWSATHEVVPFLRTDDWRRAPAALRFGRLGLIATATGIALAGLVILYIGTTEVFVATDLEFMGMNRGELDALNPRLVPLIAHDRAGFGGGLATVGLLVGVCSWFAPPARAFHQAIVVAGTSGFGCAIGTHFAEGYLNTMHLAPAFAGATLFAVSIASEIVGWRQLKQTAPLMGSPARTQGR